MAELIAQLRNTWSQLSRTQRIILCVGLTLGLTAIAGVAVWSSRTEYAYVFTNLSEEAAAGVTAKLRDDKTPYKLADGGRSVLVPADQVYEIRLKLASQGLPEGKGIGFEVFDKMNFSMTDRLQKINYQRALEGELARTIGSLKPVASARVHLVVPEKALFTRDQKDPTAAVVLTLKPGQRVDAGQVKAITNLISSAVEGLKPQNLTIVDAEGRALTISSANEDPNDVLASSGAADLQRSYEQDIESNVSVMLAKVVGTGKVAVKATALLDWNRVEQQKETYEPTSDQSAVRSTHELTEVNGQTGSNPSGVPGLTSNLPTYQQVVTNTAGAYERHEVTKNYEVTKSTERVTKAPGQIKKLSVAVILSQSDLPEGLDVTKIKELVSTAAGLDPSRGDSVSVIPAPFAQEASADVPSPDFTEKYAQYLRFLPYVAMVLGPMLLLLVLRSVLRRSVQTVPAAPGPTPIMIPMGNTAAQSPFGLPEGDFSDSAPRLGQGDAMARHVDNLAKNNPAALSRLIKTWLEEDGR